MNAILLYWALQIAICPACIFIVVRRKESVEKHDGWRDTKAQKVIILLFTPILAFAHACMGGYPPDDAQVSLNLVVTLLIYGVLIACCIPQSRPEPSVLAAPEMTMTPGKPKSNQTWRASLTLVAVVLLWFFNSSFLERQRFYRFDAALWFKAEPRQMYFMAKYLVDHQMLTGKTKGEVLALLGEPAPNGPADIAYNLGRERGFFPVDDEWLIMELDDDSGRVHAAYTRPY
jgi:hypothetical protein